MALQVSEAPELADFPFPWASQLTDPLQEKDAVCRFLASVDVHRSGLWQRECQCDSSTNWGEHLLYFPESVSEGHPLPNFARMAGLPRRDAPCFQAKVPASQHLSSWGAYYSKRGIPLSSPVALLMSVPLTLRYFMKVAGAMRPDEMPLAPGASLLILILGVQKEIDQWPVLLELACLLPQVHLHLLLVSPEVPHRWHKRSAVYVSPDKTACGDPECSCAFAQRDIMKQDEDEPQPPSYSDGPDCVRGSIRLTFVRGEYDDTSAVELQQEYGAAHMVFGPNAGLAADMSWEPAVKELLGDGRPISFFTDYCDEAIHLAAGMVGSLGRQMLVYEDHGRDNLTVQKCLNPCRHPVRIIQDSNDLPTYSNCYYLMI
ncbi:probable zinc finger MYND domain-containing protein 15 at N-terminal half [Coccomyxa sp. Obi]|nr:probable zinc finger MYND domain-containing protein 15 at N-terminal half [Coccomyxa sp. Obi]